jgi:hypothetical protein
MKHRSYINNNVANTLVEHNGELRPGNMADMKSVPWKATRNNHEHTYSGAKQGWLERMNRNSTKSWGKAPVRIPRLQHQVSAPPTESDASTGVDTLNNILQSNETTADDAIEASKDTTNDVKGDNVQVDDATPPVAAALDGASDDVSDDLVLSNDKLTTKDGNDIKTEEVEVPIVAAIDEVPDDPLVISNISDSPKESKNIPSEAENLNAPTERTGDELLTDPPVADDKLILNMNAVEASLVSASPASDNAVDVDTVAKETSSSTLSNEMNVNLTSEDAESAPKSAEPIAPDLPNSQQSTSTDEELISKMNAVEESLVSATSANESHAQTVAFKNDNVSSAGSTPENSDISSNGAVSLDKSSIEATVSPVIDHIAEEVSIDVSASSQQVSETSGTVSNNNDTAVPIETTSNESVGENVNVSVDASTQLEGSLVDQRNDGMIDDSKRDVQKLDSDENKPSETEMIPNKSSNEPTEKS